MELEFNIIMSRFTFSPFHNIQQHSHIPVPSDVLYINLHGRVFQVSSLIIGLLPDSVLLTLFPTGNIPFVSSINGQDASSTLQNTRLGASSGISSYFSEQEKLIKMRFAHRSNSIAVTTLSPTEQAALSSSLANTESKTPVSSLPPHININKHSPFRRNSDSVIKNPHLLQNAILNANVNKVDNDDQSETSSITTTTTATTTDNQIHDDDDTTSLSVISTRNKNKGRVNPFKKRTDGNFTDDDSLFEFRGFNPIRDSMEINDGSINENKTARANFDPRLFAFFIDYFKSLLQFEEVTVQNSVSPINSSGTPSKDSSAPCTTILHEEIDEDETLKDVLSTNKVPVADTQIDSTDSLTTESVTKDDTLNEDGDKTESSNSKVGKYSRKSSQVSTIDSKTDTPTNGTPTNSKPPIVGDKKPNLLTISSRRRLGKEQNEYKNSDDSTSDDTLISTPQSAKRKSSFSFQPFFRRLSSFTLSIMTNLPNNTDGGNQVAPPQQANVGPTPTPIVQTSVGLPIPTGWKDLAVLREEAEVFVIPQFATEQDKIDAYRLILATDDYLGEDGNLMAPQSPKFNENSNKKSGEKSTTWDKMKFRLRSFSGNSSASSSPTSTSVPNDNTSSVDQADNSSMKESIFEPSSTTIDDGSSVAEKQMAAKLLQRRLQEYFLDVVQSLEGLYPEEFTSADQIFEKTEIKRFKEGRRRSLDSKNTTNPRLRGSKVVCESENPLSKNDLLIALAELVCGHAVSKSATISPNSRVGIEQVGSFLANGGLENELANILGQTSKELAWSYREKEESKFKLSSCLILALKSSDLISLTKSKIEDELIQAVKYLEGNIRFKDVSLEPENKSEEINNTSENNTLEVNAVETPKNEDKVIKAENSNSNGASSLITQVEQTETGVALQPANKTPGSKTSLNFLRAHLGMKRPVRKSWWELIEMDDVVIEGNEKHCLSEHHDNPKHKHKHGKKTEEFNDSSSKSSQDNENEDNESTCSHTYQFPSITVSKVKVWVRRTWTVEFCSV